MTLVVFSLYFIYIIQSVFSFLSFFQHLTLLLLFSYYVMSDSATPRAVARQAPLFSTISLSFHAQIHAHSVSDAI